MTRLDLSRQPWPVAVVLSVGLHVVVIGTSVALARTSSSLKSHPAQSVASRTSTLVRVEVLRGAPRKAPEAQAGPVARPGAAHPAAPSPPPRAPDDPQPAVATPTDAPPTDALPPSSAPAKSDGPAAPSSSAPGSGGDGLGAEGAVGSGGQASGGAAGPSGAGQGAGLEDENAALVHARLQAAAARCYPAAARRFDQKGTVTVGFCVEPGGRGSAAKVEHSSGSSLLDEASGCVIERAAPFPPAAVGRCYTVPVRFGLVERVP